ncbi:MAG: AAA family ATPase, partial [Bacteroidales bacterium]|nr:AAA family ATPase [Bacteroidales bacterium]
MFTLGLPNKEVRIGLSESLLPTISKLDSVANDSIVYNFYEAIKNDSIDDALNAIKSWIASIPYDVMTKK